MILDKLENLSKYNNIPNGNAIISFLKTTNIDELPLGDHEILGEKLFVKVMKYKPKNENNLNFEIHKNYTDVQLVWQGIEKMQVTKLENLSPITDYNPKTDFQFFKATSHHTNLIVNKKYFAVFFCEEAHKPGCLVDGTDETVLKLVFKTKP